MAGKPLPTKLKILRGNPGRRPLPQNELEPSTLGEPRPPRGMSDVARAEYRRLIRQYRGSGLITQFDRASLAMLCELYARWLHAEQMLRETDGLVIETKQGNKIQNPWLGIANRAQSEYRRWCSEFGLTPVARARIAMPERTQKEDEFSRYLARTSGDDGESE